jgi:methyl-accepting chemotaxis protein
LSFLAEKAYQFRGRVDALKTVTQDWTATRQGHHGQASFEQHKALAAQLGEMSAARGAVLIAE